MGKLLVFFLQIKTSGMVHRSFWFKVIFLLYQSLHQCFHLILEVFKDSLIEWSY